MSKLNANLKGCNLCGTQRYYLVYRDEKSHKKVPGTSSYAISEGNLAKPKKIVRCVTCGLVYVPPSDSFFQIKKDYEDMVDEDYLKEEKGRRAQSAHILSKLKKSKKDGQLLDIGCGPGFFLDEAKRLGWQVSGVDLSLWAKEYAKKQFGIEVRKGTLVEANFSGQQFDVVIMNDVIEHLENPSEVLTEIRRILKHDGILYLSTPDINSFWSHLLGARWWGINKYHLFYFSKRTLRELLSRAGFKILRHTGYPRAFSFNYWTKRLKSYPVFIWWPIDFITRIGNLGDRILKINLHDQIGVVAGKIKRLDTLEDEKSAVPVRLKNPKVIAVLPAYNAEKTLEKTVQDIPKEVVNEIILVDDVSQDGTVRLAKKLGLTVYVHKKNRGYGGNQKTCYAKALEHGADIVVMVHPDYQYDPTIIPELIDPIIKGEADAVFGSRMMKGGALEGGMPPWKHNANILLTAFENVMLGAYLTEYHSGFRAYSRRLLETVRLDANSDNFIFDTEIIVQALANRFKIEEVPIRTRYFEEASSIKLWPSIVYGLSIIRVMLSYWLHSRGWIKNQAFEPLK